MNKKKINIVFGSLAVAGSMVFAITMVSNSFGNPFFARSASAVSENTLDFNVRNELKYVDESVSLTESNTFSRGDEVDASREFKENKLHAKVSNINGHTAADDIWRGGVFIYTGKYVEAGKTYKIAYDLKNHDTTKSYQLCLQKEQWTNDFIIPPVTLSDSERVEQEFTVGEGFTGDLWLYIRFGNVENELEISNLTFSYKKGYTYSKEYSSDGLVLNVTDGHFDGWMFGLVNWNFPTVSGKTYYCEFVLTIDSYGHSSEKIPEGSGAKYDYSEVVLRLNEGHTGAGAQWYSWFNKDEEFTTSATFTADGDSAVINLQLGGVRGSGEGRSFRAAIKKFVMKEDSVTGNIVHRINFESGESFVNRWKAAHIGDYFCDGEGAGVCRELLLDYLALRSEERDAIADELDVDGESKIVDSVNYFLNRYFEN